MLKVQLLILQRQKSLNISYLKLYSHIFFHFEMLPRKEKEKSFNIFIS